MARNYVQGKDYRLAGAGIAATDTSIVLTSMQLPNSEALITMTDFGAIGFITIEPETDREENASFTGITQNVNGTATLTGVTRGLTFVSPSTTDTNLRRSHSGGTIVRVSNSVQFYENLANRYNTQSIFEVWSFTPDKNPKYLSQPTSFGDLDLIDKAFLSGGTVYDYWVDTGAADAIVITPTTSIGAYTAGQHFFIKVIADNTGATTININGLGVKSLKKSVTVDLDGGDLLAGQVILVAYDGTNFQLVGGSSGGSTSGSGLSQISEVFSFSDFADDGSGNGFATFAASLPEDAVPVGVVYDITTGFDATSTLKVLNSIAGAKVIGGSVVATAVNVLTGQTDGSNTSFDFGATPNPIVYIAGVVPTQGVATVTVLYSTSNGTSSSTKKVGVGEISDIEWFNAQLPFDAQIWTVGTNRYTNIDLGAGDSAFTSNADGGVFPQFGAGTGFSLRFNGGKQVIVQMSASINTGQVGAFGLNGHGDTNGITIAANTICAAFVSNGTNLYAQTATGAARTSTDLGVVVGSTQTWRIEFDPGNTTPQVRFYIDGVLVATNTTNLPASATEIGITYQNDTGDTLMANTTCPSIAVEI